MAAVGAYESLTERTGENTDPNTANPNPKVHRSGEEDHAKEDGEISTIDEASRESTAVMHPLENSWTFWFQNPSVKSKNTSWGSSLRCIYTFAMAEEFWSVYNNMHYPSKLAIGADFHCFKHKIEPKWEDPSCANGGKWTMTFPRGKTDTAWMHTLLAMIGEQFDHGDEICGAVVNVRVRQEKISLWTKNAANEDAQMSIGKQWKALLDYKEAVGFMFHDDAKNLARLARNRYTV